MTQYVAVPAGPAWILATAGASLEMNEEFVLALFARWIFLLSQKKLGMWSINSCYIVS